MSGDAKAYAIAAIRACDKGSKYRSVFNFVPFLDTQKTASWKVIEQAFERVSARACVNHARKLNPQVKGCLPISGVTLRPFGPTLPQ